MYVLVYASQRYTLPGSCFFSFWGCLLNVYNLVLIFIASHFVDKEKANRSEIFSKWHWKQSVFWRKKAVKTTIFCNNNNNNNSNFVRSKYKITQKCNANNCLGRVIFLTISDPKLDQPTSDTSIFSSFGRLILMHRTHFMQNHTWYLSRTPRTASV